MLRLEQTVAFCHHRPITTDCTRAFSKTLDDASDFDEQPQNPFALFAERALSRQHQRHRLVFNALWELPIGDEEPGKPPSNDLITKVFGHIEVAPIFSATSGRPANPLAG